MGKVILCGRNWTFFSRNSYN